jgi:hypothetical protein
MTGSFDIGLAITQFKAATLGADDVLMDFYILAFKEILKFVQLLLFI